MSQAYSDISVVRQQLVSVSESRGCTLMVRGPRHGSLSGVKYGCATLPMQQPSHAETFHKTSYCIFHYNLFTQRDEMDY